MRPGPRNLITDVAGLAVGNASDPRLRSGVTVLTGDRPFIAAVDVRGGAPGTRETDLLAPGRSVAEVDAIVLSGGSAFGLEAAAGVMAALHAAGRGFAVGPVRVPIVPAAILFDLLNGGDKAWSDNPYSGLGRAALAAAGADFALGSAGAGTGALTASLKGGLGSASAVTDDGFTVGALVAVNALGDVVQPGSRAFWAGAFEIGDEFGGLGPRAARITGVPGPRKPLPEGGNTTIAIVATDADLDRSEAHRLAEIAHDGLARAIWPAHTPSDGDLVFAVATGARRVGGARLGDRLGARRGLEQAGAACLARAIARGVYAARPHSGDLLPCWCQLPG